MSSELLVTTSFALLAVDGTTGRQWRLHEGDGLYYGIAVTADWVFVAARRRLVSSPQPIAEERGQILVFDHAFRLRERLQAPFPLRDMHQIAWHDGALYVTCCYDDLIAVYRDGDWQRCYPRGAPPDGTVDRYHFNSLAWHDGGWCVVAHNRGASELLFCPPSLDRVTRCVLLGRQAHNVWRRDTEWCTCSSGESALVGSKGFCVETSGFPRGVAFVAGRAYIGVSAWAERAQRDASDGAIQVYTADWRLWKHWPLYRQGLVLDLQEWKE